eukprot:scaffold4675_cov127-Amphora_coffeaeformis.AAC.3
MSMIVVGKLTVCALRLFSNVPQWVLPTMVGKGVGNDEPWAMGVDHQSDLELFPVLGKCPTPPAPTDDLLQPCHHGHPTRRVPLPPAKELVTRQSGQWPSQLPCVYARLAACAYSRKSCSGIPSQRIGHELPR